MNFMLAVADVRRIPLPDKSVDFVMGSPPYLDRRTYGIKAGRKLQAWVQWMLEVTAESLRVSKGCVVWIAAGSTKDRNYQPACEGLMWEWWKLGGHAYRPCYWYRSGISGSGGDQWFRADVEYAMCFKEPGKLPWTDNTAMGHTPKYAPGGEMSHRMSSGARINQWGRPLKSGHAKDVHGKYQDGVKPSHVDVSQGYMPPVKANPGNLVKVPVGGGHLGHKMAHENEAPYPEGIPEWFIPALCPPGGIVLDPFSGSGTTASVAARSGRIGIGFDLRMNQCELGRRRITAQVENPRLDKSKPSKRREETTGQLQMFPD